jgi:hypothetical protein
MFCRWGAKLVEWIDVINRSNSGVMRLARASTTSFVKYEISAGLRIIFYNNN